MGCYNVGCISCKDNLAIVEVLGNVAFGIPGREMCDLEVDVCADSSAKHFPCLLVGDPDRGVSALLSALLAGCVDHEETFAAGLIQSEETSYMLVFDIYDSVVLVLASHVLAT
jgi:hypothetical protein